MDTKKIQALMQTARCGSINKAAEQLGYTQSGLTYLLNTLETELSFPLLQRGRSGVQLTPEALQLLPYMENILEAEKLFHGQIAKQQPPQGHVRVGCYSSVAISWLPPVIRQFQALQPDCCVDLRIGNMSLISMLENDDIDFAIVDEYIRSDFEWEFLQDDYLCIYLPRDYPQASQKTVTLKDLENLPCVFPSYESRDLLTAFLGNKSLHFNTAFTVDTLSGSDILQFVSNGLGVTFLSHLCAFECPPNIKIIPIEPAIIRPLGVIRKKNKTLSPPAHNFLKLLRTYLGAE